MNRNAFAPRKRLRSLSITGTAVTTVLLLISSAQAQAPDLAPRPGTAGASFPHPFAVQSPSQEGTIVGPLYYPPSHQDISGVWWTQSYSSKIPIVGGGDLPFSEIAVVLDEPVTTLKSRMTRGLERLRAALGEVTL